MHGISCAKRKFEIPCLKYVLAFRPGKMCGEFQSVLGIKIRGNVLVMSIWGSRVGECVGHLQWDKIHGILILGKRVGHLEKRDIEPPSVQQR